MVNCLNVRLASRWGESIEEVVDKIQSQEFWQVLVESRYQHDELDQEIQKLLDQYQDEYGKRNILDES